MQASDLALIREYLLKHFTLKQLEEHNLLDRKPDSSLRRQLAEISLEFFGRYYLSEHLNRPLASVHYKVIAHIESLVTQKGRAGSVLVMPRGFGKTTLVTLVLPLWCTCFNLRRYIPIISDSFDQAKEQLETLKHELMNNAKILEDFGALRGDKWQEAEIETTNHVKIIALGARMKIRGRKFGKDRPDLVILDDIENLKSVQSPTQREALYAWFTRDVMRCGWDDTKVLVVGNFLHHDCLLARLAANPMFGQQVFKAMVEWPERADLWDQWTELITNLADPNKVDTARAFYEDHAAEMEAGAKSAWPEAFPVYELMTMLVSEGETSFMTELQNSPTDPSKRLLRHWGTYRKVYQDGQIWLVPSNGRPSVKLSDCAIFAYTDPSLGKTVKSDYSAIIIMAKAPTRQQFVLEADIKRRPPHRIIADQVKWARQYSIMRWGIESVQFQAMFATESARQSMEQGVYLPVMPINTLSNKELRIGTLEPDLTNEYLLLSEDGQDLLKQQLEQFPMGAYNDGPDALEGARSLAREWEPLSGAETIQGSLHQFGGVRVAPRRMNLNIDPYKQYDDAVVQRLEEALGETIDEPSRAALVRRIDHERREQEIFVPATYF